MTNTGILDISTHHTNVLVVDDSKAMRGVISSTLEDLGVTSCRGVSSAEEALDLVKHGDTNFHVLFIDLNMPGMDGMQLIHELSDVKYTGGIVILSELDNKIIQLAGEITKKHRVHLIGCLSKPITPEKIVPTLQKLKTLHRALDKKHKSLNAEELQTAIREHSLVPYYQPLINNQSGNVYCLEILARIIKPGECDALPAGLFIETAEREGMIEQLTMFMFESALKEYPQIVEEFGIECKLSLNISPALLKNQDLPEQLNRILERNGFQPENIILELTENQVIDQTVQLETLNRLRIQGFNLALDDYGTGFTNIQQLKNLPYTEIKIDRSLIYGISRDKLSQIVANSLFDIFGELHVEVIAEGVETAEDLNYLNALPVPIHFQGFIISKPKSLDNILRWHHSWRKTVKRAS